MTEYVANKSRDFKACESISNSAKLLGGYMTATGITDAKTIAETLNIPLRTVQRLKLEYATSANDATGGVSTCANDAKCATDGAEQKEIPPTPPKEKTTTKTTTVNPTAARDDGRTDDFSECKTAFNGSTEAMLAEIEHAMGGHCRKNAEQWLANLLRINGQDAVAQAFQKLLTARAEKQIIARILPWWGKTAKNCKAEAKPAAKKSEPMREPTEAEWAAMREESRAVIRAARTRKGTAPCAQSQTSPSPIKSASNAATTAENTRPVPSVRLIVPQPASASNASAS